MKIADKLLSKYPLLSIIIVSFVAGWGVWSMNRYASKSDNLIIDSVCILGAILLYIWLLRYAEKETNNARVFRPLVIKTKYKVFAFPLLIFIYRVFGFIFSYGKSDNQTQLDKYIKQENWFSNSISHAVFPAVTEEIIFRGIIFVIGIVTTLIIMKHLHSIKTKGIALICCLFVFVVVTSLFFGVMHIWAGGFKDYVNMWGYVSSGVVLAIVFVVTRDIKLTMLLHFTENLYVTLRIMGGGAKFVSELMFVIWSVVFAIMIIGVIILAITCKFNSRLSDNVNDSVNSIEKSMNDDWKHFVENK
ncbi:hypothetical protein V760_02615 [Staphylococcus aureus F23613]|uniref:CPBP family intramembrane glutamic endopeptidase n=1 Tax=Staphylococcus aureus TaxID=1280 RepID=UPI000449661C|nr:CPBP family intramembrane glutamic endopeptidase [Staphylococcus aureus]EXQ67185.1 hypothetical protein V760_02615 [Staphylococcus aureus F23613]